MRRIITERPYKVNMQRVLVTGGAGFIGSNLCRRLLEEGYAVTSVDNYLTGTKINIRELSAFNLFSAVEHDITNPLFLETDLIYNLACPGSPVSYQENAIRTVKASVLGSVNMLGLARRTGATIIQASTSEVYGDPEIHPQPESYLGNVNPVGPRACYDEGKRCAETLFMSYHRQHQVRVKILRIFNTYGPGMLPGDGRVISNFITQALHNRNITIYGNGSQTRSFQYIDDLIEAMMLVKESDDTLTGPLNIGNPEEITIVDLAKKIIDLTSSSSKLIFLPLPDDDPLRRQPDTKKAEKLLGWKPVTPIDEGLRQSIAYFEKLFINNKYKIK